MCMVAKPQTQNEASASLICGILNIIFPGIPAMIYGCIVGQYCSICAGIVQLILTPLLIGYLYAVIYGIIMIVNYSNYTDKKVPENTPAMVSINVQSPVQTPQPVSPSGYEKVNQFPQQLIPNYSYNNYPIPSYQGNHTNLVHPSDPNSQSVNFQQNAAQQQMDNVYFSQPVNNQPAHFGQVPPQSHQYIQGSSQYAPGPGVNPDYVQLNPQKPIYTQTS